MSYNEIEGAEIVLGIWVNFFNPEFQKIDNVLRTFIWNKKVFNDRED